MQIASGSIDRSQPLFDHLGRDDEVTARFVVERRVRRLPHGIKTSGNTDERGRRALVPLQEGLISPIAFGASPDMSVTRIDIDQPAADTTNGLIGEVPHDFRTASGW